jgi:hypothetical protein
MVMAKSNECARWRLEQLLANKVNGEDAEKFA